MDKPYHFIGHWKLQMAGPCTGADFNALCGGAGKLFYAGGRAWQVNVLWRGYGQR